MQLIKTEGTKSLKQMVVYRVGNGLRLGSLKNFFDSRWLVFQRNTAAGLDITVHFDFVGQGQCQETVILMDRALTIPVELTGTPDSNIPADSKM